MEIEISGKTYKVYTLDVGNGATDYVDVRVATGPGAVVTHVWRPVPRNGPTWNRVMSEAADAADEASYEHFNRYIAGDR